MNSEIVAYSRLLELALAGSRENPGSGVDRDIFLARVGEEWESSDYGNADLVRGSPVALLDEAVIAYFRVGMVTIHFKEVCIPWKIRSSGSGDLFRHWLGTPNGSLLRKRWGMTEAMEIVLIPRLSTPRSHRLFGRRSGQVWAEFDQTETADRVHSKVSVQIEGVTWYLFTEEEAAFHDALLRRRVLENAKRPLEDQYERERADALVSELVSLTSALYGKSDSKLVVSFETPSAETYR